MLTISQLDGNYASKSRFEVTKIRIFEGQNLPILKYPLYFVILFFIKIHQNSSENRIRQSSAICLLKLIKIHKKKITGAALAKNEGVTFFPFKNTIIPIQFRRY